MITAIFRSITAKSLLIMIIDIIYHNYDDYAIISYQNISYH